MARWGFRAEDIYSVGVKTEAFLGFIDDVDLVMGTASNFRFISDAMSLLTSAINTVLSNISYPRCLSADGFNNFSLTSAASRKAGVFVDLPKNSLLNANDLKGCVALAKQSWIEDRDTHSALK